MSRESNLRDILEALTSSRRSNDDGEEEASSSGPSRALQRELLFSLLRSSISGPEPSSSSSRRRDEEPSYESFRDYARARYMRMNRARDPYEEMRDHFGRRSKFRRDSDSDSDSSSERWGGKGKESLPRPNFRIRNDREYIDILDIFDFAARNHRQKW